MNKITMLRVGNLSGRVGLLLNFEVVNKDNVNKKFATSVILCEVTSSPMTTAVMSVMELFNTLNKTQFDMREVFQLSMTNLLEGFHSTIYDELMRLSEFEDPERHMKRYHDFYAPLFASLRMLITSRYGEQDKQWV